jgi:hypothetical protein
MLRMRILSILFFLSILGTALGRFKGGKAIRKMREAYEQQSIYRKKTCYRNTRYLISTPDLNPAFGSYDYKNLGQFCSKEIIYQLYDGCVEKIKNDRNNQEFWAGVQIFTGAGLWLFGMIKYVMV